MTIDDLARRLDSAASEVSQIRAELAGGAFELDRAGKGADELAGLLESAWTEQTRLGGRVSDGLRELAVSVAVAADGYRATDGEAF